MVNERSFLTSGLTYLLIYISEIGTQQVIPPKRPMEAFIWLGIVVASGTLGNDIIEEVQ